MKILHGMRLSVNWFLEDNLDFEYKKYIILAYIQKIEKEFGSVKLYPGLSELIKHYKISDNVLNNFRIQQSDFPKQLDQIENGVFKYKELFKENQSISELKEILEYSIDQFSKWIQEGKNIYDFLEEKIVFESLGILSNNKTQGYIFLRSSNEKICYVYNYKLSPIQISNNTYESLNTNFIDQFVISFSNTYESKKRELLFSNSHISNPSTYVFESSIKIPIEESFLPIAKRMLYKKIGDTFAQQS